MPETSELSERELEILKLVATGASNKEIGQQLYISANTVKVHLRNIFSKIGATTRTEAAMYAVQIGLVPTASPAESESPALESGGDEASDSAVFTTSQVIELQPAPRRYSYTAWAAFTIIAVLVLLGVWAVAAREGAATPAPASLPVVTVEARWQPKASLPQPNAHLAVAAFENQLYAIGGQDPDGVSGSVNRYNPQTDAWERRRSKPTPVADVSAAVIGGKVYVPGGRQATGELTAVLEIYDPAQNRWQRGADLPIAISAYALASLEGKLYLFGGWDGKQALASVYRYDPGADAWEALAPMPTARAHAGAGISDGKLYIIGGFDGTKALAVNEVYLPAREGSSGSAWEAAEPMPDARYAMGVASVVDIIYVIGGQGDQDSARGALEFIPSNSAWAVFEQPVEQTWSYFGMVLSGSFLYLLGGELDGSLSDQNLAYQAIYTVAIPSIIK
jgi:DNA-binding CsgD family transcriptional regulator